MLLYIVIHDKFGQPQELLRWLRQLARNEKVTCPYYNVVVATQAPLNQTVYVGGSNSALLLTGIIRHVSQM